MSFRFVHYGKNGLPSSELAKTIGHCGDKNARCQGKNPKVSQYP
jgi:hypothetical protein